MAEQSREWFKQGIGYRVQSGTLINGKVVGYGMITDEHCGYTYYRDGTKLDISTSTSIEVCGRQVKDKEPGKIIYAKNGDIHLEAVNGQITLKAASIRLIAEDGEGEITFQAGKVIESDAPTNRVKGTNVDIAAKNSTNLMGNYVESAAGVQQSSSSLTDLFQGSFIGQILNSLGNLKKFLKINS